MSLTLTIFLGFIYFFGIGFFYPIADDFDDESSIAVAIFWPLVLVLAGPVFLIYLIIMFARGLSEKIIKKK